MRTEDQFELATIAIEIVLLFSIHLYVQRKEAWKRQLETEFARNLKSV